MRHGILLIDKPEGPTSHDIVQQVRNILAERNIGHLGTLDPLASGLLVLFVGRKALKVLELFQGCDKSYEARIVFGKVSATYDREGPIELISPRKGWSPPSDKELSNLLREKFLGDVRQTPPLYSALHIDGKRAYEVVRGGDGGSLLALPQRTVRIARIQLISYRYPEACVHLDCSSGTYVRSLAHDLGGLLRCGAYLENLRRTRVGPWKLGDALDPALARWADIVPLKEVLLPFPRLDLTADQWEEVRHGRAIPCAAAEGLAAGPESSRGEPSRENEETLIGWFDDLPVVILEREKPGGMHPRKVL